MRCCPNCGRWRRWAPAGWGANPHANGGVLLRDLDLPPMHDYAVEVSSPATESAEATRVLGTFLRDVIARNPDNFRLMGPDETASNRLSAVFETTDKVWLADISEDDEHLASSGRVMEVLSEHLCQGWLEGYLLTGRHGLFNCYEAFVHIVDSMVNQHAKWLTSSAHLDWRRPVASLNYLLTSHVWRQDHNGASHQDPGFIDHVANKRPEVVRVYLPPDANTLLAVGGDHCLRSRQYVNVIVAGKQPALTYLTMDEAVAHCTRGAGGIWEWASSSTPGGNGLGEPDVVLACAGDVPTLETLAAADILRRRLPDLGGAGGQCRRHHAAAARIRASARAARSRVRRAVHHRQADHLRLPRLSVVDSPADLPAHQPCSAACARFKERGTTTTPFDMVMLNDLDRFHLVMDVIDRVPGLGSAAAGLRQEMVDARLAAKHYTREHGEDDPPAITGWTWQREI